MCATPRKAGAKSEKNGRRNAATRHRPFVRFARPSPLHGSLDIPAACCPEEEDLAKSLAEEFAFSLAAAAANPENEYDGCAGSILKSVRHRLAGLDARQRRRIQSRARKILAGDPAEQRRHFGAFAGPAARYQFGGPVLDGRRRSLLKKAVQKRVDDQRGEISALLDFHIANGFKAFLTQKTTLEGILSLELAQFFKERNINEPESLVFRWMTEVEETEVGRWELRRLPSGTVIASGFVGLGQLLTIDFAQYLAPQPPATAQHYEVIVTPCTAPKFVKEPGATPGSTITTKVPAKVLGLPSNPVRLAYVRDTSLPQVFDEVNVFRTLELHIDQIEMVEQQSGSGKDEYWLYGSVHEIAGAQSAVVHELPKRFALLPEPGRTPTIKTLNDTLSFHLEYPSSTRWPKTYVVVLSVLEEDGGEDVAGWMSFIYNAATGWLGSAIYEEVSERLEDVDLNDFPSDATAATIAAVAAAISGSIAAAIGGMVLAFAASIIVVVTEAVADDFYGTKSVTLLLPTSTEDYIAALDGTAQPDGSFRLRARRPTFKYETSVDGVKLRDGVVEVTLHWELKEKESLLGSA